jgi:hypothetical protein
VSQIDGPEDSPPQPHNLCSAVLLYSSIGVLHCTKCSSSHGIPSIPGIVFQEFVEFQEVQNSWNSWNSWNSCISAIHLTDEQRRISSLNCQLFDNNDHVKIMMRVSNSYSFTLVGTIGRYYTTVTLFGHNLFAIYSIL